MQATINKAKELGGTIEFGGKEIKRTGFYVEPTIISGLPITAKVVQKETFAPIVYILEFETIDEAITLNNSVEQGLSSSLFTNNLTDVFRVKNLNKIYYTICFVTNS